MTFDVIWLDSAKNDISELWFNSRDQNEIMTAAETLQERLCNNPHNEGESREEYAERIAFEPPLQVIYRVYVQKHRVLIRRVARFGRPK
ncbi:hypothetical protein BH11PLA2_BH11PLA2_19730 [soil metagenome]